VPNGTLFADGIAARIKEQMLKEYNLHTVVRLPDGVFEPYTSIPCNILFFSSEPGFREISELKDENQKNPKSSNSKIPPNPSSDVWFYEIQPPAERKKYSKTKPIQFEEFTACITWWNNREENENAWRIPTADILQYDAGGKLLSANLDRKNPTRRNETEYAEPADAIAAILEKERQLLTLMEEIQQLITL
jgi:type I restriction enzyme M protein